MERGVFHRPEVLRELQRFVELRLHTDVEADWSEELLAIKNERLEGDSTMPIYEVVDPSTRKTLGAFRGADILSNGQKFTEFLQRFESPRG